MKSAGMSLSQVLIFLTVAIAAVFYLSYRVKSHPTAAQAEDSVIPAPPSTSTAITPAGPTETQPAARQIPHLQRPNDERRLREITPTAEDLRAEVAKDPHLPPPTLMKFAAALGERMQAAEKSELESTNLVSELDECLRNENHPEGIRAMCLASASRLAKRYPTLQDRTAEMVRVAGPRISNLAK